jgi:hypothetical protein
MLPPHHGVGLILLTLDFAATRLKLFISANHQFFGAVAKSGLRGQLGEDPNAVATGLGRRNPDAVRRSQTGGHLHGAFRFQIFYSVGVKV